MTRTPAIALSAAGWLLLVSDCGGGGMAPVPDGGAQGGRAGDGSDAAGGMAPPATACGGAGGTSGPGSGTGGGGSGGGGPRRTFSMFVGPTYAAELQPAIAIARDLDRDGMADLVVATGFNREVAVLRALGDGAFDPPVVVVEHAETFTVGDFDRDGISDLAVGVVATDLEAGRVLWLRGRGDAGFAEPAEVAFGLSAADLATGDFDGDGDLDLAMIDGDVTALSVLLNRGDGRFTGPVNYPVQESSWPIAIATAELNGDCADDLAFVSGYGDEGVRVLLTRGPGGFMAAQLVNGSLKPVALVATDLDGDHLTDIAVPYPSGVAVLFGDGRGRFAKPVLFQGGTPVAIQRSIAAGDLDGDGHTDLVVSGVVVFLGDGQGGFEAWTAEPEGRWRGRGRVAVGDVDGNGLLDVLVADADVGVTVLLNTSN